MGRIIAVCTSDIKGVAKNKKDSIELKTDHGIMGDAHAGSWHRQVSLLSFEKIETFKSRGAQVDLGAFGENIVVSGIDLSALALGTNLQCNQVILQVTQIGKACHHHCKIYEAVGDCIMPREGIFTKVIHGGFIKEGDLIEVV